MSFQSLSSFFAQFAPSSPQRPRPLRIFACSAALALMSAAPMAQATVTYYGTGGVQNNIFENNSQGACSGCHSGGGPGGRDFDSYAAATALVNSGGYGNVYNDQVAYTRVSAGEMPPTGIALTTPEINLLNAWKTQRSGATPPPAYALPQMTTGAASSVGQYSATISGTGNGGGASTGYYFQYGLTAGYGLTTSTTTPADTGGGLTQSASFGRSITGLRCGSTYHYLVRGTNLIGSGNGGDSTFATDACPTITAISNVSVNEDTAIGFTVGSTNKGGGTTVSYAVDATSLGRGITINSSSGALAWSAASTPDAPTSSTVYSVTVTATYSTTGSPDSVDTDAFTITVTPVNDLPALAVVPDSAATKNSLFSYNLGAYLTDVDSPNNGSGAITWEFVSKPTWLTTISSTGTISGTPGDTALATESVTVRAYDIAGVGSAVSRTFSIAVGGTNVAPVLTAISPVTKLVNEDALLSFAVGVTDADDPNNGSGALSWSLIGAPAGMAISSTGTVTWTPTQASLDALSPQADKTYSSITVRVADGGENAAAPATTTFNVKVVAVNDAPVVAAGAPATAQNTALAAASWQPTATDSDDSSGFTWSFDASSAHPSGITINAGSGLVSWAAPQFAGVYTAIPVGPHSVVVKITDSHGASGTRTFSFSLTDTDTDTVADYRDNCVGVSNSSQANLDGDSQGDACDSDIDGDGVSNAAETANGYDPAAYNNHAVLDKDGDGLTNQQEFDACVLAMDASCDAMSVDNVPPVVTAGAAMNAVASAFFTPMAVSATAVDVLDGAVTARIFSVDGLVVAGLASSPYYLRPGAHIVVWEAFDEAGNRGTASQDVAVKPLVTLGGGGVVAAGNSFLVPVRLNGVAPSYPVRVSYSVSGAAISGSDFAALPGTLDFNSGETVAYITVQAQPSLSASRIALTLSLNGVSGEAALGASTSFVLGLSSQAEAPTVDLRVTQNGRDSQVVFANPADAVTVAAQVYDPDGSALTYTWDSSSLSAGVSNNGSSLSINPTAVAAGSYPIKLTLTDGSFSVVRTVTLVIQDTQPSLGASDSDNDGIDDASEGAVDSNHNGLWDYLEVTDGTAPELIPLRLSTGNSNLLLMAVTDVGLQLNLGSFAVAAQSATAPQAGIQVFSTQVADGAGVILDLSHDAIGAIYDVEVSGVTPITTSVHVVLPLPLALTLGAQWRQLSAAGQWVSFTVSLGNDIRSAMRVNGQCPAVQSAAYVVGLVAGNDCVQLTLTDGGANDGDGVVNGAVRITAAPAVLKTAAVNAVPPTDSQTGSADIFFLVLMAVLGFSFRRKELVR